MAALTTSGECALRAWSIIIRASTRPPSTTSAVLVSLRNAAEDLLGLRRPLDLKAVESFLFFDATLPGRHRDHRRLVNQLKAGAVADRARLRFLHPGRPSAAAADPGGGGLVGADRDL